MIKLILAATFFFQTAAGPVWMNNLEDAKQLASNEQKLILLNFSGSDWCIPCMRLRKEVFDTDAFTKYAAAHLILVNADFPRKKNNQLTKDQQQRNDKLADMYNPQGSFPFTVLLDSKGNILKIWDGFYKNGVESFVNEIQSIAEKR